MKVIGIENRELN